MTQTGEEWYSAAAATFGDRLCAAREAAGLSQAELAQALGVDVPTLVSWENDTGEPSTDRLQTVTGLLAVSLDWLMTGTGDGLDAPVGVVDIPPDVAELLQEMQGLRARMTQMIDRMGEVEHQLQSALRKMI